MTSTLDQTPTPAPKPPPPPPVQAELGGPISEQPIGAPSQEMTASGETGAMQAAAAAPQPDLGITPAQGPSTAGNNAQAASGVNTALAQTIAMAISLGLDQTPTNAAGWAQLADKYSTSAGQNAVSVAEKQAPTSTSTPTTQPTATNAVAPTTPVGSASGGMAAFLSAIRTHESSGDYQANSGDGAYGAYQFIPATWNSEANAAGYGQYANGRADLAPPQVQDAVANFMAQGYFKAYGGDFNMMARAWFDPAYVNDPGYAPPGNNGLTIGAYGADIVKLMGQAGGAAPAAGAGQSAPHSQVLAPTVGPSTNTVVGLARSQLGVPYQWGGESQGQAFDCSGLVQWAYAKEGVQLPRVAQAQYDATQKVQGGAQNLQPGDLLFFGTGPTGVEHVGIYIGNGQMIDAPHTGADVRIDTVFDATGKPTWAGYVGATRPADPGGTTTAAQGTPVAQSMQQSQANFGQIMQNVTTQLAQLNSTYPGIFDTTQAVMP